MLKIKNRAFQPIQITLRSPDHRTVETTVIGARGEIEIEEDLSTAMIDNLEKRGLLSIERGC